MYSIKFAEINPFIRYAQQLKWQGSSNFVGVLDCRIIYVEEGTGTFETEGASYELKPGMLLYCPTGSIYRLMTPSVLTLSILNFDLTQTASNRKYPISPIPLENFCSKNISNKSHIEDLELLNHFFFLSNASSFYSKIQAIADEFFEHKIYYREIASGCLKDLLIRLCREKESCPSNALDQVIDYIHLHYPEPLTNQALAELSGYHEYYLNRRFLKHTGLSLHKYLIHFRLKEARRLLLETQLPISVILERTGFNSIAYFSDSFTKEYGMSPSKYRKAFRNSL